MTRQEEGHEDEQDWDGYMGQIAQGLSINN